MSKSISRKNFLVETAVVSGAIVAAPATFGGEHPQDRYFRIKVVDKKTGRGVPLVELSTTNNIRFITDSNGLIAFDELGLMDKEVFFSVKSHGYEYPADGFGNRGVVLQTTPGKSAELKINRTNSAERLYRLTGEGIYQDSMLLGADVPIQEPLLNGKVMGQDSAVAIPYRGQIHWFFGDTSKPSYPLGNFNTSGATSKLPEQGGLDPNVGVNLDYFTDDDGFSRAMIPLNDEGVVWLSGLLTLKGNSGQNHLIGHYSRLRELGEPLGQGLVIYNDTTDTFEKLIEFDLDNPFHPRGGSTFRKKEAGITYLYFPHPYPNLRVPASMEALKDPACYEAYTPLVRGSRYKGTDSNFDRDSSGKLQWGWKANTSPITSEQQAELVNAGKLDPNDIPFYLRDKESGDDIIAHGGTVCWNDFRNCWVMIVTQLEGTSNLGEVWYAEAPEPKGPWKQAAKIVTHDEYSFYNPIHHSFLDQKDGRFIYFQGTYTSSFSNTDHKTPRYDYNQIMYRLDLAEERLHK